MTPWIFICNLWPIYKHSYNSCMITPISWFSYIIQFCTIQCFSLTKSCGSRILSDSLQILFTHPMAVFHFARICPDISIFTGNLSSTCKFTTTLFVMSFSVTSLCTGLFFCTHQATEAQPATTCPEQTLVRCDSRAPNQRQQDLAPALTHVGQHLIMYSADLYSWEIICNSSLFIRDSQIA